MLEKYVCETITISETVKPPLGGMGGSVHDWERSLDPWHKDAFKGVPISGKQIDAISNGGERKGGWLALDGCGNAIGFVPDGATIQI